MSTPDEQTAEAGRPDWFDPQLLPYESHVVELDGHQVHYLDAGSGPTLLMLHGNPTWSFLYRRLIAGLSGRFRCVAPDYPGFGLSRARPGYGYTAQEHSDLIRRFVAALDLRGVVPIVQDWGGPIGIAAVQADPDRYAGLIVGNTWAWPSPARVRPFSEVMGGLPGSLTSQRLNLFVRVMIPQGIRRRRLSSAETAMYRGPFPTADSRAPVRILPREIFAAEPLLRRIEAGLPAIADLPALLFWADRDFAFSGTERRRWQRELRNRTDYTLHGAGHYWQDDAGEEAALAIADWYSRVL